MLFACCAPDAQDDRVRLFATPEAALAVRPSEPIWIVSVRYLTESRRIDPSWIDPEAFDPRWWAPAYDLGDGSIIVRAPIPWALWAPLTHESPMAMSASGHEALRHPDPYHSQDGRALPS